MKPNLYSKAPDFDLPDQNGEKHTRDEYLGGWLLVYFYPKDNTPGCTKEACSFRDDFSRYKNKMRIVGISSDTVKSHNGFSSKYNLPFTLLSDENKRIIKSYGVNGTILPKRTSFLISPSGYIAKIYNKVDPTIHSQEILRDINKVI